jgi:hypothetical protein
MLDFDEFEDIKDVEYVENTFIKQMKKFKTNQKVGSLKKRAVIRNKRKEREKIKETYMSDI